MEKSRERNKNRTIVRWFLRRDRVCLLFSRFLFSNFFSSNVTCNLKMDRWATFVRKGGEGSGRSVQGLLSWGLGRITVGSRGPYCQGDSSGRKLTLSSRLDWVQVITVVSRDRVTQ